MSLRLVTAASTFPVTLAEAKAQCRIDSSDEDALINGLIAAATDYVELYTGRAIASQTWELVQDDFCDEMLLTKGPVISVTSVKYNDTAGVEQTVAPANYDFDNASDPQRVVKDPDYQWPDVDDGINNVIIRFVAGYATVPASIKHAMLLLIAHWYAHREAVNVGNIVNNLPNAVEALLTNYRSFA